MELIEIDEDLKNYARAILVPIDAVLARVTDMCLEPEVEAYLIQYFMEAIVDGVGVEYKHFLRNAILEDAELN